MDASRQPVRGIATLLMFLLPVLPIAMVLNATTTTEGDANIGGGILLLAGLGFGGYLASATWTRQLRWRVVAIGAAALIGLLALTYGLDSLE